MCIKDDESYCNIPAIFEDIESIVMILKRTSKKKNKTLNVTPSMEELCIQLKVNKKEMFHENHNRLKNIFFPS